MGKTFAGQDFDVGRRRMGSSGYSARVILGWAKVALQKKKDEVLGRPAKLIFSEAKNMAALRKGRRLKCYPKGCNLRSSSSCCPSPKPPVFLMQLSFCTVALGIF